MNPDHLGKEETERATHDSGAGQIGSSSLIPPNWPSHPKPEISDHELLRCIGYGSYGEGYVRFSLTLSDDDLERALGRLTDWHLPSPATR